MMTLLKGTIHVLRSSLHYKLDVENVKCVGVYQARQGLRKRCFHVASKSSETHLRVHFFQHLSLAVS